MRVLMSGDLLVVFASGVGNSVLVFVPPSVGREVDATSSRHDGWRGESKCLRDYLFAMSSQGLDIDGCVLARLLVCDGHARHERSFGQRNLSLNIFAERCFVRIIVDMRGAYRR